MYEKWFLKWEGNSDLSMFLIVFKIILKIKSNILLRPMCINVLIVIRRYLRLFSKIQRRINHFRVRLNVELVVFEKNKK